MSFFASTVTLSLISISKTSEKSMWYFHVFLIYSDITFLNIRATSSILASFLLVFSSMEAL